MPGLYHKQKRSGELAGSFFVLTPIYSFDTEVSLTKIAHWYREVRESGFQALTIVATTISLNYTSILNYFINRSTNATAESYIAKKKAFRSQV